MKRTLAMLCASLAVALTAGNATAATAPMHTATAAKDSCASKPSKWERMQCENYAHSAPGDEYFGRMKMSYLGIDNTFRDEWIRAGAYTTDSGIISKVNFADEALNAWSARYPRDPELARSYFLAIRMYKKIYTQSAQEKAWKYMHMLVSRFPTTYFGKLQKTDLARGFTEHWFADAQPCPTTGAAPTATADAKAMTDPKPGDPKIDIMTPPCVKSSP